MNGRDGARDGDRSGTRAGARGTRKRAEIRKEEIVSIAADIFATKGYSGASLRDIAERAGLTKAALYYHFPDKEQIFEMVVMTRMATLNAAVSRAVAEAGPDPIARIHAFFDAAAGRIDEDPMGWIASSNTFWTVERLKTRPEIIRGRDAFEQVLRDALRDGREAGLVAEEDAGLVGRMLISGLDLIPRWMNPDGPLNAREIMRRYLRFALAGVLTDAGRANLEKQDL